MKRVHFISVGGSVMHSLAIELKRLGYIVTGSDDAIYEPSKSSLINNDIYPNKLGWFESNITDDLDFIILGMHAKSDNSELKLAKQKKIKIYSFPEFIFEYSKNKTRVVIAGSHGKTTISSMILHVLKDNGKYADYLLGAKIEGLTNSVSLSQQNEFIIIEGDEYLSSRIHDIPKFHVYQPNIALISGISWDHVNVFPTFNIYKNQFKIFIDKIVNGGVLIYNNNDLHILSLLDGNQNYIRKIPYTEHNFLTRDGRFFIETDEGLIPLKIFGKHNMENLSAAKQVCNLIGLTDDQFYNSIRSFKGASNRLEIVETNSIRTVIKDFAHSPSKLKASIDAVKSNFKVDLLAVYELYTFSSFDEKFQNEYEEGFSSCDYPVIFIDKFNPKLKNRRFDEESLKKSFKNDKIVFIYNKDELNDYLINFEKQKICLLLMSSGKFGGLDIDLIAKNFCKYVG
ncbi:MAG: UDP-N-acetylmuramate--L-alanine ligase [Flavobacteriaceae bacterium]